MIRRLEMLPDQALGLMSQVGDGMKQVVAHGDRWLATGAQLGAVKSGSRIALGFVRRNPAIAVATVAGAGLLWYAARRRAKRAENGNGQDVIEGESQRVEAKRGGKTRRAASGTRSRRTRASQDSSATTH